MKNYYSHPIYPIPDPAPVSLGNSVDTEKNQNQRSNNMNDWILCSEKMPESQQRVLAFYNNEYGKDRIELACYIPPRTVKSEDYFSEDAGGCEEYDEVNDCYWVIEGWFEDSWEADTNWHLSQTITHWMPLPKAPETTAIPQPKEEG